MNINEKWCRDWVITEKRTDIKSIRTQTFRRFHLFTILHFQCVELDRDIANVY